MKEIFEKGEKMGEVIEIPDSPEVKECSGGNIINLTTPSTERFLTSNSKKRKRKEPDQTRKRRKTSFGEEKLNTTYDNQPTKKEKNIDKSIDKTTVGFESLSLYGKKDDVRNYWITLNRVTIKYGVEYFLKSKRGEKFIKELINSKSVKILYSIFCSEKTSGVRGMALTLCKCFVDFVDEKDQVSKEKFSKEVIRNAFQPGNVPSIFREPNSRNINAEAMLDFLRDVYFHSPKKSKWVVDCLLRKLGRSNHRLVEGMRRTILLSERGKKDTIDDLIEKLELIK